MGKIIYIKEGKKLSIQIKDTMNVRVIKAEVSGGNLKLVNDTTGDSIILGLTDGTGRLSFDVSKLPSDTTGYEYVSVGGIDTSNGLAISEFSQLRAPINSQVTTPFTTAMTYGITEEVIKSALGLSEDTQLTSFNHSETLAGESKALQLSAFTDSVVATVIGAGADSSDAKTAVAKGLSTIFGDGTAIDLTNTDTLSAGFTAAAQTLDEGLIPAVEAASAKVVSAIADLNASISAAVNLGALSSIAAGVIALSGQANEQAKAEVIAIETGVPASDFVSIKTKIDNDNIKTIVNKWIENPSDEIFTNSENDEFYGAIKTWDVSRVTDMSGLFKHKHSFNDDISGWNVSNVKNMNAMFCNAHAFNQNISGWNVQRVTDMSYMFSNAKAFNQNLNEWNVSAVTDMSGMFLEASAFNQPLNKWDVSNVIDMSYMFYGSGFNRVQDINSWVYNDDVERFAFCSLDLSGCDLSACDLSGVDLSGLDLSGCDLSGVDLSGVDLSNCKCDLSGVDLSKNRSF